MRLGKESKITEVFDIEKMLPAGGQGSLALQIRKIDKNLAKILHKINDEATQICVKSERAFLRELGASCTTPVGAYAYIENKKLILKTAIIDYDGGEIFETTSKCEISLEKAIELGVKAGEQTKKKAQKLLQKIV